MTSKHFESQEGGNFVTVAIESRKTQTKHVLIESNRKFVFRDSSSLYVIYYTFTRIML